MKKEIIDIPFSGKSQNLDEYQKNKNKIKARKRKENGQFSQVLL